MRNGELQHVDTKVGDTYTNSASNDMCCYWQVKDEADGAQAGHQRLPQRRQR